MCLSHDELRKVGLKMNPVSVFSDSLQLIPVVEVDADPKQNQAAQSRLHGGSDGRLRVHAREAVGHQHTDIRQAWPVAALTQEHPLTQRLQRSRSVSPAARRRRRHLHDGFTVGGCRARLTQTDGDMRRVAICQHNDTRVRMPCARRPATPPTKKRILLSSPSRILRDASNLKSTSACIGQLST